MNTQSVLPLMKRGSFEIRKFRQKVGNWVRKGAFIALNRIEKVVRLSPIGGGGGVCRETAATCELFEQVLDLRAGYFDVFNIFSLILSQYWQNSGRQHSQNLLGRQTHTE